MRLDQINIRDPFIYSEEGTYYLYGTRGAEAFVGKAGGLDVYVSKDLQEFEGPFTVFERYEGFFFGRYVTDGPFLFRTKDDVLHMIWSSYGKKGYNQLLAHSDNNEIDGNWTIDRQPLFENDGGHGMVFEDGDGKMKLVLHYPNKSKKEHPILIDIGYENNRLIKIGGSK